MKRYLILGIIASVAALFISVKSCRSIQQEKNRLRANQQALLDDITLYRTKDSLSVASVEKLTLTKNELEQYSEELAKTIKDLGIKISRLESASRQVAETKIKIAVPVHDTIIIVNKLPIAIKSFDWRDSWVFVSGVINRDTVSCEVASVDTLVQIIHRIPKKFLFFRWGTKAIRQEIVSKNPHTNIVYTEYIEMDK
jgi:gas vesicle protein